MGNATSKHVQEMEEKQVSEDVISSQAAEKINKLESQVAELRTLATDRRYFMDAYRNMLGPNGLAVAKMWDDKGVKRVHFSWGHEAFAMSGEERAQHILDWEAAPRRVIENIDTENGGEPE